MKEELILLRDAVLTDDLEGTRSAVIDLLGNSHKYSLVSSAARYGSFDRAYTFFNEMLPEHIVYDMDNNSRKMGWSCVIVGIKTGVYSTSHENTKDLFLKNPAKALLLACLNALIKQYEE